MFRVRKPPSFIGRSGLLIGIAALLGGSVATAAPPQGVHLDPSQKVHPLLQYGAQVQPDKTVRVIVQKESPSVDGQAIAHAAGTSVIEEFGFVKSLVLELPQRTVLNLAHDPHVRYVSPDGAVKRQSVNVSNLQTYYPLDTAAALVWNDKTFPATGAGVTVAILDTGVASGNLDFAPNSVQLVNVNPSATGGADGHGHGTHVGGIIKAKNSAGTYTGVAPDANLISVKIADDTGAATEADLLRGLQWVYDNRASTKIRVVNLSVSASIAESYLTSPVDAAVEQLWLNGITVVAAAGNRGSALDATWYAPANDPYAITVGCLDENQDANPLDDSLCTFSSSGKTQDGYYKPDLVAPGRRIYSTLASKSSTMAQQYPDRISADGQHIRLSGTSMAAPVVTGEIALLLQRVPGLTPNQLKWAVTASADKYTGQPDSAGRVDAYKAMSAVSSGRLGTSNQKLTPNTGINLATDTVMWGSSYWDSSYWDSSYWDSSYWDVAGTID